MFILSSIDVAKKQHANLFFGLEGLFVYLKTAIFLKSPVTIVAFANSSVLVGKISFLCCYFATLRRFSY